MRLSRSGDDGLTPGASAAGGREEGPRRRGAAARDGRLGVAPQPHLRLELRDALDGMDSEAAHRSLDRVLATLSIHAALRDVVLPYLRELGDRWEAGEVTVAEEHFAS